MWLPDLGESKTRHYDPVNEGALTAKETEELWLDEHDGCQTTVEEWSYRDHHYCKSHDEYGPEAKGDE